MTYEELIESIKTYAYDDGDFESGMWLDDHCKTRYVDVEAMLKIAEIAYEAGKVDLLGWNTEPAYLSGYEAAAKDSSAWYILDRNGERVHMGDTVHSEPPKMNNYTFEVCGLNDGGFCDSYGKWHSSDYCEKVTDTREKVTETLVDVIETDGDQFGDPEKTAEEIVSRIEAIVRAELEGGE